MTNPPGDEFQTVVKRLLATPPKPHDGMKLGRKAKAKTPKIRAARKIKKPLPSVT